MEPTPYSPSVPSMLVKATAGQRFVAILIDGLIFSVPQYILVNVMGLYSLGTLITLLSLGYTFTKDTAPFFGGQSIGKKTMGIKVVHEADGTSILNNWGAGIIRYLSLFIPLVDPILVLIGKDRLGDGWAKTMVVKA
ncbi:RDD family protein [uncultured Fibrella sp.]|uniref:RDD family protein n=1 Tax=uncultured Fibrella sp. TaxID=1284596 RepID=UPI0035CCA151